MDAEHHAINGEQPERACYSRFSDCRWETVRELYEVLVDRELPQFKATRDCANVLADDTLAADFVRLVAPHYSIYTENEDSLRTENEDGLDTEDEDDLGANDQYGLVAALKSYRYSILPYTTTPNMRHFVLLELAERDVRIWGSQEVTVLLWHPAEAFATLVEKGGLGTNITATELTMCERRFKLALYRHYATLYTTADIQLLDTNEYCRIQLKWPYKRHTHCPPFPPSPLGLPANGCPCPRH